MIWSRYNYLFKTENQYLLYNALSNGFAEIDGETYEVLSLLQKTKKVNNENLDKDLQSQLMTMKSIVENDEDEIDKLEYINLLQRFDSRRLILTINPTLDCNFNCPYCFENQHSNVYMTEEVEEQIIQYIRKCSLAKALDITWFGGEPLLGFEKIVSLTRKMLSLGLYYSANIITNGYLLSKDIILMLPDLRIHALQITLDGLAPLHDKRRCLKTNEGTFYKILRNIDLLKSLVPDIKLSIRVNIDKTNEKDFIKLYRLFDEKKYTNFYIYPAFVEDNEGYETNSCIFKSKEKIKYLIDLKEKYGIDSSIFYPSSDRYECAIRNKYAAVIGPRGELYKCWNDVGNDAKITGYLNNPVTNETLLLHYLNGADPFKDSKCRKCFLLPVCGGGCPYVRLENKYNGKNIEHCPLFKYNVRDFLIMHYKHKKQIS